MFSDAEIQSALDLFLNQNIQYTYSKASGARNLKLSFTDIQKAAATAFLLEPRTLPYIVMLSARRLRQQVLDAEALAIAAYNDVKALKRKMIPMTDVTELEDAQVALQELASVAGTVGNASSIPSYERFKSVTADFVNKYRSNIVSEGAVVSTPAQVRATLPGRIQELKDAHAAVVDAAKLIANVDTAYNKLNLPSAFTASMADQIRLMLGRRSDRLQLMTEEEREAELRATIVEVLAARGALRQIETKAGVLGSHQVSGFGAAYADASHPVTAPKLTTVNGPFDVRSTNNTLQLRVDSTYDITVQIPASSDTSLLVLRAHAAAPYTFAGEPIVFNCAGSSTSITPANGTYTATELVTYLNVSGRLPKVSLQAVERIEGGSHYVDIVTTSEFSTATISATAAGADILGYAGVITRSNYFTTVLNLASVLRRNAELSQVVSVSNTDTDITLTTKGTGLGSSLMVSGSGSWLFGIKTATATTPWVKLSKSQSVIQPQDRIVVTSPQVTYTVLATSKDILKVSPELDYNHINLVFGVNTSVTSRTGDTTSELLAYLRLYAELSNIETTYYNLAGLLNTVLVDKNPTYSDIHDLQSALLAIHTELDTLAAKLATLDMPSVEQVDTVLRTYQQKGCNRAIDLLLSCRLEEFFGMSIEEASYVGNMTKKLHAVAQNDMAIDAQNRKGVESRVLSSTASTDFDTDFSD